MNWIVTHMKRILLVCGALTCTMIYAAIAPGPAMQSMFGASIDGPAMELVVRSWGLLIAMMGALLIYAAYHPPVRPFILTVVGISKLHFVLWGIVQGIPAARVAVVSDSLMVLLFAVYLLRGRR